MVTEYFRNHGLIWIAVLLFAIPTSANMAKPWVDGSQHSILFTDTPGEVRREQIRIGISETDGIFFAQYTVTYEIFVDKAALMPLTFVALDLKSEPRINVNGKSVSSSPAAVSNSFKGEDESNLFSFDASLRAGKNVIVVAYDANIEYRLSGLEREYTLKYALYPSKYWMSFGPVDIRLDLPSNVEFTDANIGNPDVENGKPNWILKKINVEEFEISLVRKKSVIARILLWLTPPGIASIAFVILGFLNVALLKRYPKRAKSIFWFGIFIVPTAFYYVFLDAFNWIDAALHQRQNHGYTFLWIVTWPLFVVFYGIYLWRKKRRLQRIGDSENA